MWEKSNLCVGERFLRIQRRSNLLNISVWLALSLMGFAAVPAWAQTYVYNRAEFAVGRQPVAAVAGDFNGDGKRDLAVINEPDNTISILLGRPDATFAPKVDYPISASSAAFCAETSLITPW